MQMKFEQEQTNIRVAVVSYDANWLTVVGNYFSEQEAFAWGDYYRSGEKVLQALSACLEPHILIVDEQLQDMDLSSFMEQYAALTLARRPIVIGLGNKRYLGYVGNLFSLGLTDFMAKPFELSALTQRCLKLRDERMGGRVKRFCDQLYQEWGLEPSEYPIYLTDAVKIASDTVEKLALRKEIVWRVAELHDCSHSAVDSSLRRLIQRLEEQASLGYLTFKEQNGLAGKKLQVGQLVYTMKDMLFQQFAEEQQLQSKEKTVATV